MFCPWAYTLKDEHNQNRLFLMCWEKKKFPSKNSPNTLDYLSVYFVLSLKRKLHLHCLFLTF